MKKVGEYGLTDEVVAEIMDVLSFDEPTAELAHRQRLIRLLWEECGCGCWDGHAAAGVDQDTCSCRCHK